MEESFNLQAAHDLYYVGVLPAVKSFNNVDPSCSEGGVQTCLATEKLSYDHTKYPGVVPRTFIGAFFLSSIARLVSMMIPRKMFCLSSHPLALQFLIRFELLLIGWLAHLRLASSVESYFQKRASELHSAQSAQSASRSNKKLRTTIQPSLIASYYLLITAVQFHLPFYSSRLLPNTFALVLVTIAYSEWFSRRPRRTAIYLVFTAAIFRCDMLLLLFTVGLAMLVRRDLSVPEAVLTGAITGVVSLAVTVPLDSVMWGRPIWPEFEVWYFNTVDNRSSEWGEQPVHWYMTSALPKGMLATAFLLPLAFIRLPERIKHGFGPKKEIGNEPLLDKSLVWYFTPVCGFVLLYSLLPHKEIRFIFPALPMFNVCAAYGMGRLHQCASPGDESRKLTRYMTGLMYFGGAGCLAATLIGSLVFTRLSSFNYPGGEALVRLRWHLEQSIPIQQSASEEKSLVARKAVRLHVDVAAAMTGVSLFGQKHACNLIFHDEKGKPTTVPFRVDKSGYEETNSSDGELMKFTHLLTEQRQVGGFSMIEAIEGHPRLDMSARNIATEETIYIHERSGWRRI